MNPKHPQSNYLDAFTKSPKPKRWGTGIGRPLTRKPSMNERLGAVALPLAEVPHPPDPSKPLRKGFRNPPNLATKKHTLGRLKGRKP